MIRNTKTRAKIRELNDAMRADIGNAGHQGRVLLTRGVTALEPTDQIRLLRMVKEFDDFSVENDPHKEHEFGKVTLLNTDYFWKFDYYDENLEFGSEDASDPVKTTRVLTILRADEY